MTAANGAETVALTLRLTEVQHQRLRSTSFILRRPISELIREAIDGHHWHATGIWCDECPDAATKRADLALPTPGETP